MFQKKGIDIPKTLDDMVSAAEKLTDPKEGTYGFVGRGLRNANMTLWTNFFLNYGGEFLDAKGNILTDGPEAIEATKLYQRLLTKVARPGLSASTGWSRWQLSTQGRAAMWIDGVGWAPPLEDPAGIAHCRKVGYTVVRPARRDNIRRPMAMVSASRRPLRTRGRLSGCAMASLQDPGARLLQAGGGVPFRIPCSTISETRKGRQSSTGVAAIGDRFREDQQAWSSRHYPGRRIPRYRRGRGDRDAIGR